MADRFSLLRPALVACGGMTLLVALWAGLARLGGGLPAPRPHLALLHGPLMVSGFLGILIGLERALAVGRRWALSAPLLAAGSVVVAIGSPVHLPAALAAVGASGMLAIAVAVLVLRHRDAALVLILAGALAWLAGNVAWAVSALPRAAVPWWASFVVLTIAGERLELSRVAPPPATARRLFWPPIALLVAGPAMALVVPEVGVRLLGGGLLLVGAWLSLYDFAVRSRRFPGVHRYTAICLLTGYAWLAVSGGAVLALGTSLGGLAYDATVHALFVGFVFGMIFGHAPIIAPMLVGRRLAFDRWYWSHLVLLQAALVLRTGGGLAESEALRAIGAWASAAAILLFVVNTVRTALRGGRLKVGSGGGAYERAP